MLYDLKYTLLIKVQGTENITEKKIWKYLYKIKYIYSENKYNKYNYNYVSSVRVMKQVTTNKLLIIMKVHEKTYCYVRLFYIIIKKN